MALYTGSDTKPATLQGAEGSQPSRFRRASVLLGQQTTGPTRGPEDLSPRVWTQDSPMNVLQTIPRFASMPSGLRKAQDSSIAHDFVRTQTFLASGNLFFTSQEDPCSVVLLGGQNIPDTKKFMESHHLVVRLVVVVYICVIYLLTLATHGTYVAIGTLNKPV